MKVQAYAKVNLTLEVFPRRADGYHDLKSIVMPVSLCDAIDLEPVADGSISSNTGFPDDLCVKAARSLREHALSDGRSEIPSGVRISVTKRIPVGGGLGGGSADAAAVLLGLDGLWNLGYSPEELAEIGAEVGSDVPALVLGQHYRHPVLMEGRGERVRVLGQGELGDFEQLLFRGGVKNRLALITPGINSSTPAVFRRFDELGGELPNSLERAAKALYPGIERAMDALQMANAEGVRMSGAGSTVFGFVPAEAAFPTSAEFDIIPADFLF